MKSIDFTIYPNWEIYDDSVLISVTNSLYDIRTLISFNVSNNKNYSYETEEGFINESYEFISSEKVKRECIVRRVFLGIDRNEYIHLLRLFSTGKFGGILLNFDNNAFYEPIKGITKNSKPFFSMNRNLISYELIIS